MNEEYSELIVRYFCNELTDAERAMFEQRLATDSDFRQEVEAYGKSVQLIRLQGRKELQSELAKQGHKLDSIVKTNQRQIYGVGGLAVVIVVLLAWWLWGGKPAQPIHHSPVEKTNSDTSQGTAPVLPDTSIKSDPAPEHQLPQGKPIQPNVVPPATSKNQRLFAVNFQPYKDESLEPSVRGDGDATPAETFLQFYWDGKYQEALTAFNKLELVSKNKGDLQFLKANCLLAGGEVQEAIAVLENLRRTRFTSEAKWLLALAYLKNEERERAVEVLKLISADAKSERRDDAERLLRDVK